MSHHGVALPSSPHVASGRFTAAGLALHCRHAGFIIDAQEALAHIICCVGHPGCGAAKAQVRADALKLAQLMHNPSFPPISSSGVHLSGCAKSCAANEARAATLLAQDEGIYDLFVTDKNTTSPFGRLVLSSVTIAQAAEALTQQGNHFLPESHKSAANEGTAKT